MTNEFIIYTGIIHICRPQGMVMFSEACVILFMGGGSLLQGGVYPLALTSSGSHCSGRYASYFQCILVYLFTLYY